MIVSTCVCVCACVFVCVLDKSELVSQKTAQIQAMHLQWKKEAMKKKPFGINPFNLHPSPLLLPLKGLSSCQCGGVYQGLFLRITANELCFSILLPWVTHFFFPSLLMSNLGFSLRYLWFGRLACHCSAGMVSCLFQLLGLCRVPGMSELLLLCFKVIKYAAFNNTDCGREPNAEH